MTVKKYICESCEWQGTEDEAEFNIDDGTYSCPICGDRIEEEKE